MKRILVFHPWIIPTILFSLFVIAGALTHPLWGDEADTALFARNILKFGVPTAWDGTNLVIANLVLGRDLVNHVHPPLMYYLVAAFFRILGESAFIARLPFILFSIATMPLFYLFCLKITKSRQHAFVATLVLSLSVPFILYAYQARYYAITTFAGLLIAHCTLGLTEKSWRPKAGFVMGSVLFFYGNYAAFVPFWISLFVAGFMYVAFERKDRRVLLQFVFKYIGLSAIVVIFAAPWFFIFKPYTGRISIQGSQIVNISTYIQTYIHALSLYSKNGAFPIGLFFLALYAGVLRFMTKKSFSDVMFVGSLAFFDLFIMSVLKVILAMDIDLTANRYTMAVFPFLILASVLFMFDLSVYGKKVVALALFLFMFTNFLSFEPPRSFLAAYIGEITRPYPTPDTVVATYLLAHAKKGETVASSRGGNSQMVLLFYLKDYLRFVGSVRSSDIRFRQLPSYVYDRGEPDWIIQYGNQDVFGVAGNIETEYEGTVLPVYADDLSRPEIDMHAFWPPPPDTNNRIVVYRRLSSL